jgi:hypothetical protein
MDDIHYMMETGFGALLTPEEEGKKNELIVKLTKINVKKFDINNESINKEHDERNEIDNTIKKESYTKENEDWSPNAITSLLNAWRDHDKDTTICSKLDMDCTWKEISAEVSKRSGNSKKPKDCEQCKLKFKAMQGRYNREKMAKKFNPKEPNSWEWYDTMDTLFKGIPCSRSNSIDIKNIKEGASAIDNTPSLITYYDVKDKHIEKHVVEESAPTKLFSIDIKEKLQDINNQENLNGKVYEDQNMVQYTNLSTPTSPKSPRSLMKVKWSNPSSPQLNLIDEFKEENFQDNMSNSNLSHSEDESKKVLLVNELKENLMRGEQNTSNYNGDILDGKNKGKLKIFDSCLDSSMSYNESNMMDQDSTKSSPIVFTASQTKCQVNKYDDVSSFVHKEGEDQNISRFSIMELSRSINCNYKQACIESITNNKHINENKEIPKENDDSRRLDENLATNIGRGNEQMALSTARADSEADSAKILSTGSPIASVTSQSESSHSSKQNRKLCFSSRYKYERENQSNRTLITTLMRATNNTPRLKKKNRSPSRASHTHDSNTVIPLLTYESMIQQLEKNHIAFMERVLNEQSAVLNDFVKTLKYNDQVREVIYI